jgi:hypothetical protein
VDAFEKSTWPAVFGHFFDDDFTAFTVDGDWPTGQLQRLWKPDGEGITAFEDPCFYDSLYIHKSIYLAGRDTLCYLASWIAHKPVASEKALSLGEFEDTEQISEHRRRNLPACHGGAASRGF